MHTGMDLFLYFKKRKGKNTIFYRISSRIDIGKDIKLSCIFAECPVSFIPPLINNKHLYRIYRVKRSYR